MNGLSRKLKKTIFFIALVSIIGSIVLYKANKDFLILWNSNNLDVSVEQPLKLNKVIIGFDSPTESLLDWSKLERIREHPDEMPEKIIIYRQGKQIRKIDNFYGENDFFILYDNTYYTWLRHGKTNRRNQHDYNFHLYKKNNGLYLKIVIKGINSYVYNDIKVKKLKPIKTLN